MRTLGAAILATSLLVTNAFAATTLPAGKPAGVQEGCRWGTTRPSLIIAGIGLAALGIGLAASSSGGGPTSVSNTVTGTAP